MEREKFRVRPVSSVDGLANAALGQIVNCRGNGKNLLGVCTSVLL